MSENKNKSPKEKEPAEPTQKKEYEKPTLKSSGKLKNLRMASGSLPPTSSPTVSIGSPTSSPTVSMGSPTSSPTVA